MKPGLCKKTGYSCRGTFITLIKCLVLTMAFFFLGIKLKETKVGATYYIDRREIRTITYDDEDYMTVTCTVKKPDGNGWDTWPDREGCTNSTIQIDGISPYSYSIYYGISEYSTAFEKWDSVKVKVDGVVSATFSTKSEVGLFFSREITTSYGVNNVAFMPMDFMTKTIEIVLNYASTNWTMPVYFKFNVSAPTVSNFSVSDGDSTNGYAPTGYTNSADLNVSISGLSGFLGKPKYTLYSYCEEDRYGTWWDDYKEYVYHATSAPTKIVLDSKCSTGDLLDLSVSDSITGKKAQLYYSIIYDNTPPVINSFTATGTNGEDVGYTKTNMAKISSSYTEANVKSHSVTGTWKTVNENPDGKTVELFWVSNPESFFDAIITLTYTITDYAGNSASATFVVRTDHIPPQITEFRVIGNTNAFLGYTNTPELKVISSYKEANVKSHSITGGSAILTDDPNDKYVTLNNTEGSHTLTYTITDRAGNTATQTYTIIYDKTAPQITQFSLKGNAEADAGYTNQTDLKITSSYTEANVESHSVTGGVSAISGDPNGKTISLSNIEKTHILKYKIIDKAGNVTEVPYSMTLDKTAPVINSFSAKGNSEADAGYTNQGDLTITSSYTEANVKSHSVTGGAATISKDPNGEKVLLRIKEGSHTLTYTLTDKAGNTAAVKTYTIILDGVAPEIKRFIVTGNTEADAGYTNQLEVTITSLVLDLNLRSHSVTGGATTSTENPNGKSLLLSNKEGSHTLTYTVTDSAGNISTATYTIVYDKTAPSITQFTITGNSGAEEGYTNTRAVRIISSYTEENLKSHLLTDGSASLSQDPNGRLITLTNIEKAHTLTYTITDYAGNQASENFTIVYDKTAPVISSFSIKGNNGASAGYTNTNRVTIRTTYVEANVKQQLVEGGVVALGGEIELNGVSLTLKNTEGEHTLKYTITDKAGNAAAQRLYTIIYDKTAPVIGNFRIIGNDSKTIGYTNTKSVKFEAMPTITEENKWRYKVYSNCDGSDSTLYSLSTTAPTTSTSMSLEDKDGAHTITYTVIDRAGNETSKIYTIVLDTTAPTISIDNDPSDISKLAIQVIEANKFNGVNVNYYVSLSDNDFDNFEAKATVATDTYNVMRMAGNGTYFIYVDVTNIKDLAGNAISFNASADQDEVVGSRNVRRLSVDMDTGENAADPVKDVINTFTKDIDNVTYVDTENGNATKEIIGKNNVFNNIYQIQHTEYLLLTVNDANIKSATSTNLLLSELVSTLGLTLISPNVEVSTEGSQAYENMIVEYTDAYNQQKYKVVTIVIVYNAPLIRTATTGASLTVNQGEEVGNFGLSFESIQGEKVEVETLITLNGVKVEEIDTRIPGVYNIRQVARDSTGRETRVSRELIVNKVEKEELEEVKLPELEVILPVKIVEPVKEVKVEVQERVEVVNESVEMHLEKKLKVKGYKKRKEIRRAKKEQYSFKLFSKYFFKVYDG